MEIKNLKETPLADIVAAISTSFADYFVPMPNDISYWEKRFRCARVDLELSFGMFRDNKLAGFIINGVDDVAGTRTAFNTGTGVTRDARGQGVTERLYDFALPIFKDQGVERCSLEVIEQNERAIYVYDRIGFKISKRLKCFKGTLNTGDSQVVVNEVPFANIAESSSAADQHYSWDNTSTTIAASGDLYKSFRVSAADGSNIGYFVMNPDSGYVAQFEPSIATEDQALLVLSGMAGIAPNIKINNVDAGRSYITDALSRAGLDNFIDQYEMEMPLA